jgi:hypothetical protein
MRNIERFARICRAPSRVFGLIVVVVLLASPAVGQLIELDQDDRTGNALELLTGGDEREWVLERFESFLGEGRCQQGQRYVFRADGTLLLERCVEGQVERTESAWKTGPDEGQDLALLIDGAAHQIRFRRREGGLELLLRRKADEKVEFTEDRILTWLEE